MSGFDGGEIFYSDQNQVISQPILNDPMQSLNDGLLRFRKFLREWQVNQQYIYREQIKDNAANHNYYIEVDFDDLNNFDSIISQQIRFRPADYQPIFEQAVHEVYSGLANIPIESIPRFQVQIFSNENPKLLRELKSNLLHQLITVSGIIVNSGKAQLKGRKIVLQCKACRHTKILEVGCGLASINMPRYCESNRDNATIQREKCPNDCYIIVPEKCEIIDQQSLKLQEAPETVPTGEIPRTFQLCVDRNLVNKMVPGTRVTVTGIYSVIESNSLSSKYNALNLKLPYIMVLGHRPETTSGRGILFKVKNLLILI